MAETWNKQNNKRHAIMQQDAELFVLFTQTFIAKGQGCMDET